MKGNTVPVLAIVGGGASGLAAAIAAAERARELGENLEVVVHERDDRVGRSVLVTGNGRCNFSNAHPFVDDYYNAEFVEKALWGLRFVYNEARSDRVSKIVRDNRDEVHAFFYQHGLMWRTDDAGRQYPETNKASTVVDVLRASAAAVDVREACEQQVKAIQAPAQPGGRFTLQLADGALSRADAVIVACGGRALSGLDACGLQPLRQRPVLGPLRCAEADVPLVRELDNIRVRCELTLLRKQGGQFGQVHAETGELLFRKYGVSGICVFNLSRFAWPGDVLQLNFLNGSSAEDVKTYLFGRRKLLAPRFSGITCGDMLRGLLLPRVADAVLKRAGLVANQPFSKAEVPLLAEALTRFTLEVAGIGDADLCQVRRGGYDVGAFDPSTLCSHEVPGLYAAGEALDVDGPCGGYNLHWAWSSGLLAGISAAKWLAEKGGAQ